MHLKLPTDNSSKRAHHQAPGPSSMLVIRNKTWGLKGTSQALESLYGQYFQKLFWDLRGHSLWLSLESVLSRQLSAFGKATLYLEIEINIAIQLI